MTDRQWLSLGKYIRRLGDMLALRDWTFELSHQPADGDSIAQVTATFGRKVAIIQVCPNWRNLEPETQRHCLVHELLHVQMSGLHTFVYHALPSMLGEAGWSAFESAFRQNEELATDGIADAIAATFPLWEG